MASKSRATVWAALVDQGSLSLAALVLLVSVSATYPAELFGYFALVVSTNQLALVLSRAAGPEALLVLHDLDDPLELRSRERAAMGSGIRTSIYLLPLACVYLGVLGTPWMLILATLAIPASALVDDYRLVAIARRTPIRAIAVDVIPVSLQLLAAGYIWIESPSTDWALLSALVLPTAVAVPVAYLVVGGIPKLRPDASWRRQTSGLSRNYVSEVMASLGVAQVVLTVVTVVVGPVGTGSFRLVQAMFGPLHVVVGGVRTFLQPHFRAVVQHRGPLLRQALATGGGLAGVALTWTALLLIVPSSAWENIFGLTTTAVTLGIVVAGIQKTVESFGTGAFLLLRAQHRASATLWYRVVGGCLTVVVSLPLIKMIGANGGWWALLVGNSVTVGLCWWAALKRPQPESSGVRNVTVVSHAYLEAEVFKNLVELGEGVDVTLVTPTYGLALLHDRSIDDLPPGTGVKVVGLPHIRARTGVFLFRSWRLGLARQTDAVIIEYDPWMPVFWQVRLAVYLRAPGARVIISVKKNTLRRRPRTLYWSKKALAHLAQPMIYQVWTTSNMTRDLYVSHLAYPEDRVAVVPHLGVDTTIFAPCPNRRNAEVVFGFVGAISTLKGADLLLEAFYLLRERAQGVELRLVGPWRLGDAERERALRAGVKCAGLVAPGRVRDHLADLQVMVMPSRAEADHQEHDGRAVIEGLAVGLPIIASRTGVLPDLVGEDRGVLVTEGSVGALTDAMELLATNESMRIDMGAAGRAHVQEHLSLSAVSRTKLIAMGALPAASLSRE